MTEQTEQQIPAPEPAAEDAIDWRARREEQDRKMMEARRKQWEVTAAWSSREAEAINAVIREDGNVEWRDFVSHCGGIMNVIGMVDDRGEPDTRRIIPLVDELFNKSYGGKGQAMAGGMVMRLGPRNRPYPHKRPPVQPAARSADEVTQADAERLLRAAQEAAASKPKFHGR